MQSQPGPATEDDECCMMSQWAPFHSIIIKMTTARVGIVGSVSAYAVKTLGINAWTSHVRMCICYTRPYLLLFRPLGPFTPVTEYAFCCLEDVRWWENVQPKTIVVVPREMKLAGLGPQCSHGRRYIWLPYVQCRSRSTTIIEKDTAPFPHPHLCEFQRALQELQISLEKYTPSESYMSAPCSEVVTWLRASRLGCSGELMRRIFTEKGEGEGGGQCSYKHTSVAASVQEPCCTATSRSVCAVAALKWCAAAAIVVCASSRLSSSIYIYILLGIYIYILKDSIKYCCGVMCVWVSEW